MSDFGSAFAPVKLAPPPPALFDPERLAQAVASAVTAAISAMVLPTPQVNVDAPDLTEIVSAVVGIKGPASAEEIADAIAARLRFPEPADPTGALAAIADAMEKLDFRMKGVGSPAFGASGPSNISDNADRLLGHVTVDNPTASPETGLAKDATLVTLRDRTPTLVGTWGYSAGVAGTVNVAAGRRVIGIAASAGSAAGSMTINGGDTVTIPANQSVSIAPLANLTAPALVFTSTASYFVETLA